MAESHLFGTFVMHVHKMLNMSIIWCMHELILKGYLYTNKKMRSGFRYTDYINITIPQEKKVSQLSLQLRVGISILLVYAATTKNQFG